MSDQAFRRFAMDRRSDGGGPGRRGHRPFMPGMTIDRYLDGVRSAELTPDEARLVLRCAEALKGLSVPPSYVTSPVMPFFQVFLADRAFQLRYGRSSALLAAQSSTRYIKDSSYLEDAENAADFIADPSTGVDPFASTVVRQAIRYLQWRQRNSPGRKAGALLTRILSACEVHAADAGSSAAMEAAELGRMLYQDLLTSLVSVRKRRRKGTSLSNAVADVGVPKSYKARQKESVLLRLRRRPLEFRGQLGLMADWMERDIKPKAYTPAEVAMVWYWRIESCFNEVAGRKLSEPNAPDLIDGGAGAIIEEVDRRLHSAHELVSRKSRPKAEKRSRRDGER
jgi:hypothetical protein